MTTRVTSGELAFKPMRTACTGPAPTGVVPASADVALGRSMRRRGRPFLGLLHSRHRQGSRCVQCHRRDRSPSHHAHVTNGARWTRVADGSGDLHTAIETVRLDVNHVACAAHARAHRLGQHHPHPRDALAVHRPVGLHLHSGKREPRVRLEVVCKADRRRVAQLDHKEAWIGLRRNVRHRVGRLDGDHSGAPVDAGHNSPERRDVSSTPPDGRASAAGCLRPSTAGRERDLGRPRHGRTKHQ